MKKNFFRTLALFTIVILANIILAFSFAENTNTAATAETKDGYIIFFCSKPVTDYESLGEIKIKLTWSGYPAELFNQVLKKVKKDFPKADAIIFDGVEMEKATAIKFK